MKPSKRFRLRYAQHNLELFPGQFLIGRSPECQLALDDPLISRRHARLLVTEQGVYLEDLDSRNGVLVDGVRLEGQLRLVDQARIIIGTQELQFFSVEAGALAAPAAWSVTNENLAATVHRAASTPATGIPPSAPPVSRPLRDDMPTKTADWLRLLGGVADKAMALGRAEEAERILTVRLHNILEDVRRDPNRVPAQMIDHASEYAVRLGKATGKGQWIDYVIELYTLQARPLPAPIVDELYTVLRRVDSVNLTALRAYRTLLLARQSNFGPTERFLLQRVEGLERLASAKLPAQGRNAVRVVEFSVTPRRMGGRLWG